MAKKIGYYFERLFVVSWLLESRAMHITIQLILAIECSQRRFAPLIAIPNFSCASRSKRSWEISQDSVLSVRYMSFGQRQIYSHSWETHSGICLRKFRCYRV